MLDILKRCIKLLVSTGVFIVCRVFDLLRRATGSSIPASAIILYYHSIRPAHRMRFANQMDSLLRWTRPIEADHKGPLAKSGRFTAVTFDDGWASFIETALPELEKRQIPSTMFIITQNLGGEPAWPGYVVDPTFREPIMTLEQLRKLPQNLVTIGSHTLTHPTLTRISKAEATREITESRIELEKMLGRKISLFSFPHGAFNNDLVDVCRKAGYERVYTIVPHPAFSHPNEYAVGRVWTDPSDWSLEFLLKLHGAYCWLPYAFDLKQKLFSVALIRKSASLKENSPGASTH